MMVLALLAIIFAGLFVVGLVAGLVERLRGEKPRFQPGPWDGPWG